MKISIPETLKSSVVVDAITVAVVAMVTSLDAWSNLPGTRQADAITHLLVAVSIAALLVRRWRPLLVAVICMVALTTLYALGHFGELLNLPTIVALYTVAVQGNRRRSIVVGALAMLWSAGLAWIARNTWPDFITDVGVPTLAEMVLPAAALLLGESVRSRRELLDSYAARAARANADREHEARRRVEEERLRIARELHDIVAHTVAGITVQAGVAVEAFEARSDVARRAMLQVRALGREALQELRATVAVLRDDQSEGSPSPAPHLDQLNELVERTRSAGVNVTLKQDTGAGRLPAVVELAAYRIVQEALTNVIRHADAANVAVSVTCENNMVVVEVSDDGDSTRDSAEHESVRAPGFGLIGMTERAIAIGGRVQYGSMPDGGFRVHAVLPVNEDSA
ncbi:MAG: sensor histidine kinase [Actinomycetota bacterium]